MGLLKLATNQNNIRNNSNLHVNTITSLAIRSP